MQYEIGFNSAGWTIVRSYGTTVTATGTKRFSSLYTTNDGNVYGTEAYTGQIWLVN